MSLYLADRPHSTLHVYPRPVHDLHACGVQFGYRMSKCAAHMAARCLAEDLRPRGIAVAVVHPGVVATDMVKISGSKADVTPQDSAAGIARVIEGLGFADTGSFYNYLGQPMAW